MRVSLMFVPLMAVSLALILGCGGGSDLIPTPVPQTSGDPVELESKEVSKGGSTASLAILHKGKLARVCGLIRSTRLTEYDDSPATTVADEASFLDFDFRWPSMTFFVRIEPENRGNFPENLEGEYAGKQACVTGIVQATTGTLEQSGKAYLDAVDTTQIEMQP